MHVKLHECMRFQNHYCNRYKMCMKDLKNLIGEVQDLAESSKERGNQQGAHVESGPEANYLVMLNGVHGILLL